MVDRPLGETDPSVSEHTLPAIPGSVPIIRHELERILEPLGITPEQGADMRLALTEACTNAVQHAYADGAPPGEMVVTFEASAEALIISVVDAGHGIHGPSPQPGLGVGLRLMQALADAVAIGDVRPGTGVRMTFRLWSRHQRRTRRRSGDPPLPLVFPPVNVTGARGACRRTR